MTTQEMIAVLSAFEQGKKIECTSKTYPEVGWNPATKPIWNFDEYIYKIVEEPEYVPYDGTQEGTLVGKIIKNSNVIEMVVSEDKESNELNILIAGHINWISYETLFEYYQFLDGQPCGMLK